MTVLFLSFLAFQSAEEFMLSNDKLFVVLAVVLIIWAGLITYIIATDRRISRLESSSDKSTKLNP